MIYIVFSSSTAAGRLKKFAFKSGLRGVYLAQTPKEISSGGCTYSLKTSPDNYREALRLASELGLKPAGAFISEKSADGRTLYKKL